MAEPARGGPVDPAGHDVGDQLDVPAAVAPRHDDGLAHEPLATSAAWTASTSTRSPADLHLLVAPAQVLEAPIGGHATHVARPVEATSAFRPGSGRNAASVRSGRSQ